MSLLEDVFSLTKKEQIALLEELEKKASAPSPIALPQEVIDTFELPDEIDIEDELAKIKEIVLAEIQSVTINAPKGDKGDKGDKGAVGPQGPKGIDGVAGKDGKQGVDGKDGIDGISVTDARVDFDGSLVITLSNGQEINAGDVIPNDKKDLIIQSLKNSTLSLTELGIEDYLSSPTPIGDVTPNTGAFTDLSSNGVTSFTNGSTNLTFTDGGGTLNPLYLIGQTTGLGRNRIHSQPQLRLTTNFNNIQFHTGAGTAAASDGNAQAVVAHTASAVNYVNLTGSTTGNRPVISAQGSDNPISLDINAKGSAGTVRIGNALSTAFGIFQGVSGQTVVNYPTFIAGQTGSAIQTQATGTDTNISMAFQSKGTGAIDLAAGSSGVNISNGGTVTAITRTVAGVNYTTAPSLAISAPTTAGGVQATATCSLVIYGVTVANGGTGYTVGNTLTLVGGTPLTTGATYTVATVSSGVVTSVNYLAYNGYSAVPTTPAATTGGSGTGCTLNLTGVGINSAFTITNAGSGYVEQPTVTFSGGGGSSAAAIVRVGTGTTLKSLGGTTSFNTYAGEGLRINNDGFGTLTDYVEIQGGSSVSGAYIGVNGSTATASLYVSGKGGGTVDFFTNGQGNARQARVAHTASAVNYVQVTGSATGSASAGPAISTQGSSTDAALILQKKGLGEIVLQGTSRFGANQVNYISAAGAVTTQDPILSVAGTDSDISMALQSKGTGAIDLATGSSGVNISNGRTVTAITRTAVGNNYTSFPSIAISAPTTAGGVQATATVTGMTFAGSNATVVNGGTGYTVGNVLTVVGTTPASALTLTVATVSGGVITSATHTNFGTVSVLPPSPYSVTGGSGSGATFTSVYQVASQAIGNAGSGYIEQPTVTFSGGGGSGAAAYAIVGGNSIVRGLGSTTSFYTPGGEAFRLVDNSQTSNSYWGALGSSANSPSLRSFGTSTANIDNNAAAGINFRTNLTSASALQMNISHTASAVNYVQVTGATTGGLPAISAQGSDTDVSLRFNSKGAGGHIFYNGGGAAQFRVGSVTSAANFLRANAAIATATPALVSEGTDTNIDLSLTPKGTGNVRFGTYTASMALTVQGYIEIKDSGGTIRKLAVIA
jgi:hypothetical protein